MKLLVLVSLLIVIQLAYSSEGQQSLSNNLKEDSKLQESEGGFGRHRANRRKNHRRRFRPHGESSSEEKKDTDGDIGETSGELENADVKKESEDSLKSQNLKETPILKNNLKSSNSLKSYSPYSYDDYSYYPYGYDLYDNYGYYPYYDYGFNYAFDDAYGYNYDYYCDPYDYFCNYFYYMKK